MFSCTLNGPLKPPLVLDFGHPWILFPPTISVYQSTTIFGIKQSRKVEITIFNFFFIIVILAILETFSSDLLASIVSNHLTVHFVGEGYFIARCRWIKRPNNLTCDETLVIR